MEMVLSDEDIPEDCFIPHTEKGIDIICSNIGMAGTEVKLVNAMSCEFVLKPILDRVKDRYDAILIYIPRLEVSQLMHWLHLMK